MRRLPVGKDVTAKQKGLLLAVQKLFTQQHGLRCQAHGPREPTNSDHFWVTMYNAEDADTVDSKPIAPAHDHIFFSIARSRASWSATCTAWFTSCKPIPSILPSRRARMT